jgi:hypothetical protein
MNIINQNQICLQIKIQIMKKYSPVILILLSVFLLTNCTKEEIITEGIPSATFSPASGSSTIPSVTTSSISNITQTSASGGGNVTSVGGATVTARGICWRTTANPTTSNSKTTDGSGTGSFTGSLTGLTGNTTYYVRSYATNSYGTAYGNEVSFTSAGSSSAPAVTTATVTSITPTSASCGGNVTSSGGFAVSIRGICWNTNPNPTTANNKTSDGSGTGTFTSSISGLTSGTTYYVRAYATNSVGTAYGNEVTFTTTLSTVPILTTADITNITQTTATGGGNVTSAGGATVTDRGLCWSTSQNPTTANSKISVGTGTGIFSGSLTGLTANVTYYVRAYATNSYGIAYGNQISFTASPLTIGQTYQGGLLVYVYQSGDPGYVAGENHGLIAAPSDQSTSIRWYNGSFVATGATTTTLGAGKTNTNLIVSIQGNGTYAAKLCSDLVLGGYSDWYLPSNKDLEKMYWNLHKAGLGSFVADDFNPSYIYWSSTEWHEGMAYGFSFANAGGYAFANSNTTKELYRRVRAVRYF